MKKALIALFTAACTIPLSGGITPTTPLQESPFFDNATLNDPRSLVIAGIGVVAICFFSRPKRQ